MGERSATPVVFRTLQAIHDLRAVVRLAGHATRARIAAGANGADAETDFGRLIGRDGCRIGTEQSDRLHQSLVLAAALPDDDFEAFVTATAILIADRIQRGHGTDDLFWHWDAFHEHYRLAQPAVRAVLLQGFHRLQEEGLVNLQDPPHGEELLSERRGTVVAALRTSPDTHADAILAALDGAPLEDGFWRRHCLPLLTPGTSPPGRHLRAIRHLYESRLDWNPFGAKVFDPVHDTTPVLPVILT